MQGSVGMLELDYIWCLDTFIMFQSMNGLNCDPAGKFMVLLMALTGPWSEIYIVAGVGEWGGGSS